MKLMEAENYWVGREKKRYDFVLKYTEGQTTSRGYSVHKFEDRMGRRFLTYSDFNPDEITVEIDEGTPSTSPLNHLLVAGDCFTCKATVLRHDINDFKVDIPFKETVLNRVKFGKYLEKKD